MASRAAVSKLLTDWSLLGAIGICLVAVVLRVSPLGESLWLDELHTAWCAVGPLDEVARRAAIGNQGPLFFWLEWLLFGMLGPNELSLRFLSVVGGSLLPLAVFLLARRSHIDTSGLVAAALVAVDPISIFYSTEARPYALLQLLAVLHIGLTLEVINRPARWLSRARVTLLRFFASSSRPQALARWWRQPAWVALAALLFYLHYTTTLLIVTEAAFLVASMLFFRPHRLCTFLGDLALLALLCLPAIGDLQAIFAHRANWAAFVPRQPFWIALDWTPLPWWWWVLLLIVACVGMQKEHAEDPAKALIRSWTSQTLLFLVTFWIVIPVGIAWLATVTDVARLFFPRYLAAVLPAAALCAGFCVDSAPRLWQRASLGALTIGMALWTNGMVEGLTRDGRAIDPRGEDWRGCVAWLSEQLPQTQFPVLVFSGLIEADELRQPHDELLEDYCLAPVNSLYPLDADRGDVFPLPLHEPGRLDQVAEMLVAHRGGAWLIVRGEKKAGTRVADQIVTHLKRGAAAETTVKWQVEGPKSFGKVQVLLLTTGAHRPASDPSVAGP